MKTLAIALITLFLAGCTGATQNLDLEASIGIDETDNAIMCIKVGFEGRLTETSFRGARLEFPASFDTASLTPESIAALEQALCP